MRELITLCVNGESCELAVLPHYTLLGREPRYLPQHEREGRAARRKLMLPLRISVPRLPLCWSGATLNLEEPS